MEAAVCQADLGHGGVPHPGVGELYGPRLQGHAAHQLLGGGRRGPGGW